LQKKNIKKNKKESETGIKIKH